MASSSSGGPKGTGPIDPSRRSRAVDASRAADEVDPADAADAVARAEQAERAESIERTGPVTAPPSTEALDAVVATLAAELRAGNITVDQAVASLVDDAIERQVRAAIGASPDVEQELRTMLRRHLAEDPYLLAKVRRLHQAK
jgi:sulfur relay (sulfurtransferase) DsrF/TusC family protein